jgi:hypothetical protein
MAQENVIMFTDNYDNDYENYLINTLNERNIPNYFLELSKLPAERVYKNIALWNNFVNKERDLNRRDWPNVIVLNNKLYVYNKRTIIFETVFEGKDDLNRNINDSLRKILEMKIHASKKCYNILEAGDIDMINAIENDNMIAIKIGNQFHCVEMDQITKIYNKMMRIDDQYGVKLWYRDDLILMNCDRKDNFQYVSFQLPPLDFPIRLVSYNTMIMKIFKEGIKVFELVKEDLPPALFSQLGNWIGNRSIIHDIISRQRVVDIRPKKYYCNRNDRLLNLYKIVPYRYTISDDGFRDIDNEVKMSEEAIERNRREREAFERKLNDMRERIQADIMNENYDEDQEDEDQEDENEQPDNAQNRIQQILEMDDIRIEEIKERFNVEYSEDIPMMIDDTFLGEQNEELEEKIRTIDPPTEEIHEYYVQRFDEVYNDIWVNNFRRILIALITHDIPTLRQIFDREDYRTALLNLSAVQLR